MKSWYAHLKLCGSQAHNYLNELLCRYVWSLNQKWHIYKALRNLLHFTIVYEYVERMRLKIRSSWSSSTSSRCLIVNEHASIEKRIDTTRVLY